MFDTNKLFLKKMFNTTLQNFYCCFIFIISITMLIFISFIFPFSQINKKYLKTLKNIKSINLLKKCGNCQKFLLDKNEVLNCSKEVALCCF